MLAYAGVCWRIRSYADVCQHEPDYICVYTLCTFVIEHFAGVCWRTLTYASMNPTIYIYVYTLYI
jgi:hypothetical protein